MGSINVKVNIFDMGGLPFFYNVGMFHFHTLSYIYITYRSINFSKAI